MNDRNAPAASNGAKLALSWLLVGIPLVWGISNTLANAAKLFH